MVSLSPRPIGITISLHVCTQRGQEQDELNIIGHHLFILIPNSVAFKSKTEDSVLPTSLKQRTLFYNEDHKEYSQK